MAYFDVFNHPLTLAEIINLNSNQYNVSEYQQVLNKLVEDNICYSKNEYYSIQNCIEKLINDRRTKEQEAKKYLSRLHFFVGLISKFPFVRAIAISGSLSKGVMYKDGDIDYFIVTAPRRLWITRTMLVLFKKVFLLNSKKYFCVNYFVDENNLKIIDENIFTAVEITYLLPVFNKQLIENLKAKNKWTYSYFPNFKHPIQLTFDNDKKRTTKGIEFLFYEKLANHLDLWLMKMTFKRWQKKFSHFNRHKFELTMRTNRGISKHHPQDFQNKVLNEFQQKIEKINIAK